MPDSADRPESDSPSKGGFLAFWTTLPGILTGAAAMITAIVALVTLLHTGNGSPSTTSRTRATAHSSAATPVIPQTTSPGRASPDVRPTIGHGRLALRRGDPADLESGVVGYVSNTDIMFGPESTLYLHASGDAFLAPIVTSPSKRACTRALLHRHDPWEVIPELSTRSVCVSTSEGHVAVVNILRLPGVGSAQLSLGYTVWR
jgi:hypothetical protein